MEVTRGHQRSNFSKFWLAANYFVKNEHLQRVFREKNEVDSSYALYLTTCNLSIAEGRAMFYYTERDVIKAILDWGTRDSEELMNVSQIRRNFLKNDLPKCDVIFAWAA